MPSNMHSPRHGAVRPEVLVALGSLVISAASILPVANQARISVRRPPSEAPLRDIGTVATPQCGQQANPQTGQAPAQATPQAMTIWIDPQRARTPAGRAERDPAIRSFHG